MCKEKARRRITESGLSHLLFRCSTGERTWTSTGLPPMDFESIASANSATPACGTAFSLLASLSAVDPTPSKPRYDLRVKLEISLSTEGDILVIARQLRQGPSSLFCDLIFNHFGWLRTPAYCLNGWFDCSVQFVFTGDKIGAKKPWAKSMPLC